ncbi:hypothetical protein CIB84_000076 [Bambusicola thoracicus]|uniref:Centromere protein S n=1 Tax=Bambusicola thoracicus TaxID=9083 RepID=A0A2P4TII8_BAMTH|nr:hypothetical protein CIB84_000076 [Bambusicola thoracicus]
MEPGRGALGGLRAELCGAVLQRLRAAVHYTTGCLCQDVAEDKGVLFSKQTVAAISEITFRQCVCFSQLKYITQKSDELASSNMEQKEKKKKKSTAAKGRKTEENEMPVTESEDSNMA